MDKKGVTIARETVIIIAILVLAIILVLVLRGIIKNVF